MERCNSEGEMMDGKISPTASELVEATRNRKLSEMIFGEFRSLEPQQFKELVELSADLHNSGAIDLLSFAEAERLSSVDPSAFFDGQHFFCKVIPLLAGPADDLMLAVASLVEKGGQDLAANQPNSAFRAWCAVDASRSRDIIERAARGDPLAEKLLTFALEAWSMDREAVDLLQNSSDEIRLSAVTALSRITLESEDAARAALQGLEGALEISEDELLAANVLVAAVSISSKFGGVSKEAQAILERVVALGGTAIGQSSAYALRAHGEALSDEVVSVLLQSLSATDPGNDLELREVDMALRALLDSDHRGHAIEFVQRLLVSADGRLTGADLELCGNHLKREPQERIWGTLIPWLLSGERVLCEWASSFVGERPGDEPIEVPPAPLQLAEVEKVFLARKVIGYFFLNPVSCASILVSILRESDEEAAEAIADLLFDPMLVNYGGAIREFLEEVPSNDDAYPYVTRALEEADSFLGELLPPDAIKELHPSDRQRQIGFERMSDEMSAAMKRAQADSVLLSLVSRSVLLYGRRSRAYFHTPDGSRQAVDLDLHPHSVGFEMPRLQLIDPVSLEYILTVFRAERIVQ